MFSQYCFWGLESPGHSSELSFEREREANSRRGHTRDPDC